MFDKLDLDLPQAVEDSIEDIALDLFELKTLVLTLAARAENIPPGIRLCTDETVN